MATTTPNFGWPVPTSTDLVKDGATAIEALGDGIDTSLVDLKGGTTGQVLSKTSGTDMDFTWVTSDDANAIQNTIVDAKGDLIAASAADTPARLAVGTNGQVLTADSTAATGLKWATAATATGGLTKITSATFTSQTAVNVNNCFSATYDFYLLEVRYISTSGTSTMTMKFRASGADQTNNYYYGYTGANNGGTAQTYNGTDTAGSQIGLSGTAEGCLSSHTIYNPNNSSRKLFVGGWSNGDSSIYVSGGGQRSNTTAADGLSLLFSAASTGLYAIYGLEK
jgi:hypothetical protein